MTFTNLLRHSELSKWTLDREQEKPKSTKGHDSETVILYTFSLDKKLFSGLSNSIKNNFVSKSFSQTY